MCTPNDMLAHYIGAPYLDDIMSQNELTTYNLNISPNFCTFISFVLEIFAPISGQFVLLKKFIVIRKRE